MRATCTHTVPRGPLEWVDKLPFRSCSCSHSQTACLAPRLWPSLQTPEQGNKDFILRSVFGQGTSPSSHANPLPPNTNQQAPSPDLAGAESKNETRKKWHRGRRKQTTVRGHARDSKATPQDDVLLPKTPTDGKAAAVRQFSVAAFQEWRQRLCHPNPDSDRDSDKGQARPKLGTAGEQEYAWAELTTDELWWVIYGDHRPAATAATAAAVAPLPNTITRHRADNGRDIPDGCNAPHRHTHGDGSDKSWCPPGGCKACKRFSGQLFRDLRTKLLARHEAISCLTSIRVAPSDSGGDSAAAAGPDRASDYNLDAFGVYAPAPVPDCRRGVVRGYQKLCPFGGRGPQTIHAESDGASAGDGAGAEDGDGDDRGVRWYFSTNFSQQAAWLTCAGSLDDPVPATGWRVLSEHGVGSPAKVWLSSAPVASRHSCALPGCLHGLGFDDIPNDKTDRQLFKGAAAVHPHPNLGLLMAYCHCETKSTALPTVSKGGRVKQPKRAPKEKDKRRSLTQSGSILVGTALLQHDWILSCYPRSADFKTGEELDLVIDAMTAWSNFSSLLQHRGVTSFFEHAGVMAFETAQAIRFDRKTKYADSTCIGNKTGSTASMSMFVGGILQRARSIVDFKNEDKQAEIRCFLDMDPAGHTRAHKLMRISRDQLLPPWQQRYVYICACPLIVATETLALTLKLGSRYQRKTARTCSFLIQLHKEALSLASTCNQVSDCHDVSSAGRRPWPSVLLLPPWRRVVRSAPPPTHPPMCTSAAAVFFRKDRMLEHRHRHCRRFAFRRLCRQHPQVLSTPALGGHSKVHQAAASPG